MNRYVRTGDAARELGVDPATLTRWKAAGIVTPAEETAGGHFLWDMTALRVQVRRNRFGQRSFTPEDIAFVLYEANRALQVIQGDPRPSPSWEEAPEYQVQQTVAGVREALGNPQLTPEQSHDLWCDRMRADGWTHGDVKDPDRKTHPTLLPYDELPPEQRAKDRLFVAVVQALGVDR